MSAMAMITTVDELDALPTGSVVRSAEGTVGCRYDWTRGVVFGDDRCFPWLRLALPARVIYRPDQPHTVRPGVDELRSAIFHSTYPNMRWVDLTDEEASDFDKATDAIVALLPGRSEAVVKAEAIRETVAKVRQVCAGMPGSPLALWLSQLETDADRIEAQP